MNELEKPILKKKQIKIIIEKTENQCQNAACEQKISGEKEKLGSIKKNRPRMIYEWIGKAI